MKLRNLTTTLLAFVALTLFSVSAQAAVVNTFSSGPDTDILCRNNPGSVSDPLVQNCWLGSTYNTGSDNTAILAAFDENVTGFDSTELIYKAEADPFKEEGSLYSTVFGAENESATITHLGGASVDCYSDDCFLLIKDGDHSPYAYLFDLSLGWDPESPLGDGNGWPVDNGTPSWNGTDPLEIKNFWSGSGEISYVALYGNISPIPVPAAFWLFGTALLGFIGLSRSTRV
jgi:hypothetical protein